MLRATSDKLFYSRVIELVLFTFPRPRVFFLSSRVAIRVYVLRLVFLHLLFAVARRVLGAPVMRV